MSLPSLSIKHPVVIASAVALVVIGGLLSLKRLGVDMYPDVEMPFIVVSTVYPGAGPEEMEEQVSKKIEDEISSIAGLKTVHSDNLEGVSFVWGEFTLDSDVKDCEQQVRNRIAKIRRDLPDGIEEPKIERWDMSRDPVVTVALMADLPDVKLYDIAREKIKPLLEQVGGVGTVTISGGTRREIQVELDRAKLNEYRIPASFVAERLAQNGLNVPAGKNEIGAEEKTVRTVGRYRSVSEIENSIVLFSGDANNSVTLKSLGSVRDGAEDRTSAAYVWDPASGSVKKNSGFFDNLFGNDKKALNAAADTQVTSRPAIFLGVYKQSGTNTVKVVDDVYARIEKINQSIGSAAGSPRLVPIHDSAHFIRINLDDVKMSIVLGIFFAVVIVYLFLGNIRSTIITGVAIPTSLLGGFVLMYVMGFTVNIMTLLALSLTVGLLIDDAIVVRENIFRKLETENDPAKAAVEGTKEVMMAVIATTIVIIAVFFPIAFTQGIVGRFFMQFGLTIVFAMMVSLFDALTVAPFLSAYFSGPRSAKPGFIAGGFEKFQRVIDRAYASVMNVALAHPGKVVLAASFVFIASLASLLFVESTFMPAPDDREFKLSITMPSGTSLDGTRSAAADVEKALKAFSEIGKYALLVGSKEGKPNTAEFYITLVPEKMRSRSNADVKQSLRAALLRDVPSYRPVLSEYAIGDPYPFAINIEGDDLAAMERYSKALIAKLKSFPELVDVQTEYESGKPEYQVGFDQGKMVRLGITPGIAGSELRAHIAGTKVGKFYDGGSEYDVRVRLRADQRDIRQGYRETKIPNVGGMMVPLSEISSLSERNSPSQIVRENRRRIILVTANVAPGHALGAAAAKLENLSKGELPLPAGVGTKLVGDNENMEDLMSNIVLALVLSIVMIYLVLASLYGSFITPITILVAILPALSGAFLALAVTGKTLDIFSMIGLVMLIGLVAKNSILLVDYASKSVQEGVSLKDAIFSAGMHRLRPILMTTFAMLAGTLPVALGIGEAAKGRMSMGIAIIGGIILSTVLTLVVVPAIYSYVERFRVFVERPFTLAAAKKRFRKVFRARAQEAA